MSDELIHFGGAFYTPDGISWLGEVMPTVRCGLNREECVSLRTFQAWANAHVGGRPCCPECTRIVAVETGAVAGSA